MLLTIPLFAASLLSAASASILEIPDLLAARQTNGTDEEAYRKFPDRDSFHPGTDTAQSQKCVSQTPPLLSFLPARRSSTFNRPARQMELQEYIS